MTENIDIYKCKISMRCLVSMINRKCATIICPIVTSIIGFSTLEMRIEAGINQGFLLFNIKQQKITNISPKWKQIITEEILQSLDSMDI